MQIRLHFITSLYPDQQIIIYVVLARLNGKNFHYQPSYKLSASALKTRNPNNIDLIVSIDFLKAATSIIFSAEGNVDTRDNTGLIVYLAYTPTTLTYIMD